jgi:hypothetical protein
MKRLYAARYGIREFAFFFGLYGVYSGARWAFSGNLSTAQANADSVIHLERSLHVFAEASVQGALGGGFTGFVLSNVYLAAQLVVLPGSLIWLYRRDRDVYRRLRSTVIGAWLFAIPIYAFYPTAPPRLSGIGLTDTVSHQAGVSLTGRSTVLYNPYAAVPSLHVGLAFAIGIAIAAAVKRPWAKALALAWGPLVALAVVATGNHFFFDAVAGLAVTAAAYGLSRSASAIRSRPQREIESQPRLAAAR